jgi:hypothetical protein
MLVIDDKYLGNPFGRDERRIREVRAEAITRLEEELARLLLTSDMRAMAEALDQPVEEQREVVRKLAEAMGPREAALAAAEARVADLKKQWCETNDVREKTRIENTLNEARAQRDEAAEVHQAARVRVTDQYVELRDLEIARQNYLEAAQRPETPLLDALLELLETGRPSGARRGK